MKKKKKKMRGLLSFKNLFIKKNVKHSQNERLHNTVSTNRIY